MSRFRHISEIVRVLRENSGLTRNEMSDAASVAASTIRNLETGRHAASAWTWRHILEHASMADLPRLAAENSLAMPDLQIPHDPGSRGTPDSGSEGTGSGTGGDEGEEGGGGEGRPGRRSS